MLIRGFRVALTSIRRAGNTCRTLKEGKDLKNEGTELLLQKAATHGHTKVGLTKLSGLLTHTLKNFFLNHFLPFLGSGTMPIGFVSKFHAESI